MLIGSFHLGLHKFYASFPVSIGDMFFSEIVLWKHSLMCVYLKWCRCVLSSINQVNWKFLKAYQPDHGHEGFITVKAIKLAW